MICSSSGSSSGGGGGGNTEMHVYSLRSNTHEQVHIRRWHKNSKT